ncbi:MAG: biotin/lipoyl-binding protein, partial [Bacteroidia bacterium]|nr:biotin/lipoyl-binding protein [Bacteroidia bacterium]
MNKLITYILYAGTAILFLACGNGDKEYDATGSFEAIERTISAEATGKINTLSIEEGQLLNAGDTIGFIDVSKLIIQEMQVKSSIDALADKTNDADSQVLVLESQLKTQESQTEALGQQLININKEVDRFEKLVQANAVPQKQLDDLAGQQTVLQKQLDAAMTQSEVIKAQIKAARTNVSIQNRAILSEKEPIKKQLEFIQQQIKDGIIINQFDGTVTNKLAYDGEFTSIGRPLYRIADLSDMTLRVYVSGNQ